MLQFFEKKIKYLRLYAFQLLAAALLMCIEIWFTQALRVEQYVEPAASPVASVVGDFHIFEAWGVDILFHGAQVEQH